MITYVVVQDIMYDVMCLNAHHMIMIHDLDGHIKTPELHFHTNLNVDQMNINACFNSYHNLNEARKCISLLGRQNMINTPHIKEELII